ncbi:uncharacterized protein TNCV_69531 [Trichonephila clavipes]|nr:uncharacterized protein TNCV_69531 [Trichonephila clavipes]
MVACVNESAKLGGEGTIVEIDESLFGKMKYGKGKRVKAHGDQQLSFLSSFFLLRAILLEPQLLDIMIVQFRNEKVSNHGSIPITIDCNVVAFIVFEEGFQQRTKQRSCRYSGVKGSARKGSLDLRFASAWCLEIVCGTISTPTSARIVERVTMASTSAYRSILRSSLLVVFLVVPDPVFRAWVPSRVHCYQQFLTAHSERSTWPATRRVDQPAVFIPMIKPLSNSLNCEKCLLARLPGMFHLPKSSYNRRQDNARPHTAIVAQDFLRHFPTLPWPARSPDLSPVEHVWDQLKWQMPSCHSVHDLELAV